jgi:nucleoside-diphosphate-sugar epimerase
MRLALTGAAGNLGAYLLGALSERHDVVPIDRRPVDHPAARLVDLADLEGLVEAFGDCRALVHFAGEPAVEAPWESVLDANLIGVRNAFEAARRAGVERIVWASSNHAVGGNEVEAGVESYRGRFLLDHRTEIRPDSFYGASKVFGEALGRLYADQHGLRVLSLRIGHCRPDDDWRIAARHAGTDWLPLDERGLLERYAALWLSQRDLAQLVERGLEADFRYACVYGVSANPNRFHDLEEARRVLGYVPADAAVLEPR